MESPEKSQERLQDKLSALILDFKVLQLIATGSFSKVYLVQRKAGLEEGTVYVAKVQHPRDFSGKFAYRNQQNPSHRHLSLETSKYILNEKEVSIF